MKVYGGLVGGVGPPEVIPEQVITVHLGFEAGDVAVTKVLAEFIDFLQLQQVDSQDLDCLHHLYTARLSASSWAWGSMGALGTGVLAAAEGAEMWTAWALEGA